MKSRTAGFGLVELMIAMALGLLVLAGVLVIFLAQRQAYQNATSQALVQDADNALSAIVTPVIRGAGFTGCSAIGDGVKSYISGAPTPLTFDTSSAVKGYQASSMPSSLVDGAANDLSAGDWTPTLDASFVTAGGVAKGSDVLVLTGAPPGTASVGATAFNAGSIVVNDAKEFTAPGMVAVSDCGKSSIFQITSVSQSSGVLTYAVGPNGTPLYPSGSQLIPIQQTAFFVAKGHSGQNGLFEAVMTIPAGGSVANASWGVPTELVPGVSNMQVLYGISTQGQTPQYATQYVNASAVTNWGAVATVKLGFLIEGNSASTTASTNLTSFKIFNTTLSIPADSRLRHTYYMTVNLRNATL